VAIAMIGAALLLVIVEQLRLRRQPVALVRGRP
jgi:hypothetical protein